MEEKTEQWAATKSNSHDDQLLGCLSTIARHWMRPQSLEALRAGLPLVDGLFTPDIFIRSAQRVGLTAREVRKPLNKISSLTLPAVLLLKDRRACVLFSFDKKKGVANIVFPETQSGATAISYAQLKKIYLGRVIFVRPEFSFDVRSSQTTTPPSKSWFWGTLRRYWTIYGEAVVATLLINLFALASPLFIMNVYDRVVPNNAIDTLWVLAIGAMTVFVFEFIIRTLRGYFLDLAGKKADTILASRLFGHINSIKLSSQPASTGAIAKNLMEFETLRDFFTSATLTTVIDLPFTIIFLLVIYFLGGPIVWAPTIAAALVILVGLILQWPLGKVVRKSFKESSQKHAILIETLSGMETIKTLGAEGNVQSKWEQVVGVTANSGLLSRFISAVAVNFSVMAQQLAVVALVISGVFQIQAGEITMGALVACTILTGRALAPLSQLAGLLVRFQQSVVSLETLNSIMEMPVERPTDKRFTNRPTLSGSITLDNVSFAYPDQEGEVFNKISLSIKPGERIAFLGRIGSGKSTLLKLIMNLYQPSNGAILADGVDLRQIDPVDLRRDIGYVEQEPLLFFGTMRDNIVMADPFIEDAALLRAAKQSGVDEFTNRHPHGFDQVIGERGRGLSGGQRQTVAIARALLTDPPILMMDEPTSSMDSSSEERFKSRMAALLPGKTLLMVTHKASLLSLVDRVIIFEDGKIIADGPRDEIVNRLTARKTKPTSKQKPRKGSTA
ncbi:MAG: type I secretion system permease/ATPase [Magnetococcales bacterium]|nr:type I secretion system permease/ATPase [Magnetococcales bacterium]